MRLISVIATIALVITSRPAAAGDHIATLVRTTAEAIL